MIEKQCGSRQLVQLTTNALFLMAVIYTKTLLHTYNDCFLPILISETIDKYQFQANWLSFHPSSFRLQTETYR